MLANLRSMIRDEDGATLVEYGLLITLIALVAFAAVQLFGTSVSTLFTTASGSV